jgi:hypothetical protein
MENPWQKRDKDSHKKQETVLLNSSKDKVRQLSLTAQQKFRRAHLPGNGTLLRRVA